MRHAWLWATLALVVTAGGAAFLSVLIRHWWGNVSLVVSMPVCGVWGVLCAVVGYAMLRRHQDGGGG